MLTLARVKRILADTPKRTLGIVVLMIAGILAGLGVLRYSLDLRQQAAQSSGTAILSMNPQNGDIVAGQTTTIDIMFNSQADVVDGLQIEAIVSGTVPENITFTPATIAGLNPIIQSFDRVDPAQPARKLVLALLTSDPTKPYTTNSTPVKVGTIQFTAPTSGTMTITYNPQNTITTKSGSGSDILKIPLNGSYTFKAGQTAQVSRLLATNPIPANPQEVNRSFTFDIKMDAVNAQVSGVDAKLKYDPQVFTVSKVEKITGTPFTSFPQLAFDQVSGTVSVSANVGPGTNPSPVTGADVPVARVTVVPKNASSHSAFNFLFSEGDRNDSNIITYVESGAEAQDILTSVVNYTTQVVVGTGGTASPTPTPTPTPVSSPTPTPTPVVSPLPSGTPTTNNVNLQVDFQGKRRAGVSKAATLSIGYQQLGSPLAATLSRTTDGTGRTSFPLIPGNYIFLIKAPGYLARKFGSATSPLVVTSTAKTFDLSAFPLLGGDFNQDGTINEVDYSLFFLTKFRTADPLVDLDGSGEVNNLDFAIMRSNWGLIGHTMN